MPAPLAPRDGKTRNVGLVRLLRLLALLRAPVGLEQLAGELGVTTRTVRRDLAVLRAAGLRVWRSDETGCWRLDRADRIEGIE